MSLIGHWKLDGNALDSSGYGNDGVETGVVYSAGKLGSCYENDLGGARQISIPTNSTVETISDMTLSMWIYPTSNTKRRNPWNKSYGGEGTITHEINGTLNFYWGTSGSNTAPYVSINSVQTISLNTWTHILVVRKSNEFAKWYFNGVEVASRDEPYGTATASSSNIIIGNGYTGYYDGRIDDVRLYNHVLSLKEIQELSRAKILHYSFNQNSEPTINLVQNPSFNAGLWSVWSPADGTASLLSETRNGMRVARCEITTAGDYGLVSPYGSFVDTGEVVTLSVDIRANRAMTLNYAYLMRQANSNTSFPAISIGTTFTRISTTLTNSIADTCAVLIAINASIGDWIEFTNVQLEKKAYATDFVESHRSEGNVIEASNFNKRSGNPFKTIEDTEILFKNYIISSYPAIVPEQGEWFEYFIYLRQAGTYALSLFVKALSVSQDSFFISINNGTFQICEPTINSEWYWYTWNITHSYTEGINSIRIAPREPTYLAAIKLEGADCFQASYKSKDLEKNFDLLLNLDTTPKWEKESNSYFFSSLEKDIITTKTDWQFLTASTPFSISLWFKSLSTTTQTLLSIGCNRNETSQEFLGDIDLYINGPNGELSLHLINYWPFFSGSVFEDRRALVARTEVLSEKFINCLDSNWHHIVATYDGNLLLSGANIYIDGVLQDKLPVSWDRCPESLSAGDIIAYPDIPLRIGARNAMPGFVRNTPLVNGYIKDVQIFSTNISENYVRELYQVKYQIDDTGNLFLNEIDNPFGYYYSWNGVQPFNTSTITINSFNDGILSITSLPDSTDPRIDMYNLGHFDPNIYKYIIYKYRVVSGSPTTGEIYFTNKQYTSANRANRIQASLISDGNWHLAIFDGSVHPNWLHSDINGWRFDPCTSLNTTMEIAFIGISKTNKLSFEETGALTSLDISELGPINGLMAYYPLDGDVKDYSGNNYNGNQVGTVLFSSGVDNSSMLIQSQGSYVAVPNFIPPTTGFSLSAWVKVAAHGNYHRYIDNNWVANGFLLYSSATQWQFGVGDASITQYLRSVNHNNVVNTWVHLVGVYTGSSVEIFINGVSGGITAAPLISFATNNTIYVGNRSTLISEYQIDEARIYSRALTSEEVKILYDMYNPNSQIKTKISKDTVYVKEINEAL